MDVFQFGDLAFNQPTKEIKPFPLPWKSYVYVGMTFHTLPLTPEFAAHFRCKKQSVILPTEFLCSLMNDELWLLLT